MNNLIEADSIKKSIAVSLGLVYEKLTKTQLSELELFKMINETPDKTLGDLAIPSFKLAKLLSKNPKDCAQVLKEELEKENNPWISSISIKDSFVNISINYQSLVKELIPSIITGNQFKIFKDNKENVMIEFSQPNTHKEFHVGHLRNVCLGDSLSKIYSYNGYKVIPANYIGDEGTHIAKCLWGIDNYQGSDTVEDAIVKSEWLGKRYVEASLKLSEMEDKSPEKIAAEKEISLILKSLESKNGHYYDYWEKTRKYCLEDLEETYQWLNVSFDHIFYESEVSESSQSIVDEYIKKGLFTESDGAYGFDMSDKKLGFFMARKKDGTSLYITKDLALAKEKFNNYNIDKSIYVVGNEQNFHFKQLFYALEKMGFSQAKDCYHLSYGMVVSPSGKFSSRLGNTVSFSQLKKEVLNKVNDNLSKYKNIWTHEEISQTAHKLAIGSIKYGMLKSDPSKEIVFDLDEWTSFEGNTGMYLSYAYARAQSILSKAHNSSLKESTLNLQVLTHEAEIELVKALYQFNTVAVNAAESYKPSNISNYLYSLAKSYSKFYTEVSIMKADSEELKSARLALVKAFAITLKEGLSLLGIVPPEKM